MGKIPLFNESDQEEEEQLEFKTNKSYAKHYDEFRKKEILGQLKNLESEEESSSSDDETTDEEVVDPEFDKEFFRTLAYLKRSDPAKYDERATFFENVKPVEEVALEKRKKKEKPMTLKDYERKVILEKGGIYEDEEENPMRGQRAESPSLVQQQEQIKDDIKRALSKIDTDDEEEGNDSKGGLLKERSKGKEEAAKEQSDYLKWLTDKKAKEAPSEDVKPLKPLKDFWSSKTLSKEDAFLKDYILNKRFVDNSGDIPTYDDIVATSEDEEELEKQEEYERQYNFRFEEPDTEFIKRFPRNVEESMRIERNKRKEKRQTLKERKQHEKEQKKRELEELKAIKLQEIKDRIEKLKAIADTENMNLKEEDLEADFDPEEHDRRMQRMFDDDYYGVDEGDQKPEFPDLDVELGIENYDREKIDTDDQKDGAPYCEDDDFVMDADYDANDKRKKQQKDHQAELLEATSGRKNKKGKKISKFNEVLKKEKPLFDPEDEKTYGEYIDEYYKLDYEDMIGDTPCRFRYVETVPNNFGLSIEEILMANTRELNRWASVKKAVQIRPKYAELSEVELYKRKAQNESLKKKIMPSLYAQQDESDEDVEINQQKQNTVIKFDEKETVENPETSQTETKKKKKKKKKKSVSEDVSIAEPAIVITPEISSENQSKKKKKLKKTSETEADKSVTNEVETASAPEHKLEDEKPNKLKKRKRQDNEPAENVDEVLPLTPPKKKKHFDKGPRKDKRKNIPEASVPNVSDSRLRAFGINPRKFHNKLKYGDQKNSQGEDEKNQQNGNQQHKQRGNFGKQNGQFRKKNWKNKHAD